jgi:hypothetical protein
VIIAIVGWLVGIFVTMFIGLVQAIGANIWDRLPARSVRTRFWIATAWFGAAGIYFVALFVGAIVHGGG